MPWRFVEMYARMRFIDFVVSQALEINSRCLHSLAIAPGKIPPDVLQKLHEDRLRLNAMWAIAVPATDSRMFKAALKRGRTLAAAIGDEQRPGSAVALELAAKAPDEKTTRSLVKLSRGLAARESRLDAEALSVSFQEDSSAWRDLDVTQSLTDAEVVRQGIGRWYLHSRSLMRHWGTKSQPKRSEVRAWHAWCWCTVYQLELLKPELSERGKARRWYIDNLARSLDSYLELGMLRKQAKQVDLKRGAVERLQAFLDERRSKLWKRAIKLAVCAYADKSKVFVEDVQHSVERLGLAAIVILEPEPAPPEERDLA
ncbi:MAG: hypothetical protein O7C67_06530 [Gammaproteobacteria bacterium]|nr:hypothetical protein [Gammaproteobacteria bacterium]